MVARGHRVASGTGDDRRFPGGTIAQQLPLFRTALPELFTYLGGEPFHGTINLQVAGLVEVAQPEWRLPAVRWTALLPPETFFFSRARLEIGGERHPALIYIPDRATKTDHHQPPDRIELLARPIERIAYGEAAILHYPPSALVIRPAG